MRHLSLFTLVLFLTTFFSSSGFCQSDTDKNKPIPVDPKVKIGKLDNGLVYYIRENQKPENRVDMRLVVKAGSLQETEEQRGLAHFCEHMCFNGTKNFEKNELVDFLEKMGIKFGADLNANTGFERTIYILQLPTEDEETINNGLLVLEDWASNVTFAGEEIDKERGVIKEEWRLGLGARDRMLKKTFPVMLKGSRYAERIPIGKMEVVENCPYEELRNFYKDWYRPGLMAVIVVGDIDAAEIEQKIKDHFGSLTNPENPRERIEYNVPDNEEPLVGIATDKEATRATIMIYTKHKNKENKTIEDFQETFLYSLYNGMMNNRLGEISRKPEAPFNYAYTFYSDFLASSLDAYTSYAQPKNDKILEAVEVLAEENERVKQHGFTSTELERQKAEMLSRYEKYLKEADKTNSSNFVNEYINNFLNKEPIPGIETEYDLAKAYLPRVTVEDVNKLAKQWITDENQVIIIMAPEKEEVVIPEEDEIISKMQEVQNMELAPYEDKVSDAPLLAEKPAGSKIASKKENKEFGYTEITLENGIKAVLMPTDYKNDQILFKGFSPGGISLYPVDDYLSALFASRIVDMGGIAGFDADKLEKKLAGKMLSVSPYIEELKEGISGNCSPKDMETMFQLIYLYFTNPRKDNDAYNAFMSRMENQLRFMKSNPQVVFSDTLTKIVTQNDPRSIVIPDKDDLAKITLDRVFEIYQDRFKDAGDFVFFFVGNFNTDDIEPYLQTYLGSLPDIERKESWKDVSPEFPEEIVNAKVYSGMEDKSLVAVIMKEKIDWAYQNRLQFMMMTEVLNIKLRERIREEESGVYTLSASPGLEHYPEPYCSISISFGCAPDNVDNLVSIVFDEIKKLKENGPEPEDLEKVKKNLILNRESQMKENKFWLIKLERLYFDDEDLYNIDTYKENVGKVTVKDIQKMAKDKLDDKNYVKVVLLPEKLKDEQ